MLRGHELGIPLEFPIHQWRKALPLLPSLDRSTHDLIYHPSTDSPHPRVNLAFGDTMYEGSFGILKYCIRKINSNEYGTALVKQPKVEHDLLLSEALVQMYAYSSFASKGLSAHIPRVYDIFYYPDDRRTNSISKKQVWFTMEKKEGIPIIQWLLSIPNPELVFVYVLGQICILLDCLHGCGIDHRDLKADNILVCEESCEIQVGSHVKSFPFTLVLIDFGFSCVREFDVSKGAFPALDPCPKEGRDMFHFLADLWSYQPLREKLGSLWEDWIQIRLTVQKKEYKQLAERAMTNNWIYLLSGKESLRVPLCSPIQILADLCAEEWL